MVFLLLLGDEGRAAGTLRWLIAKPLHSTFALRHSRTPLSSSVTETEECGTKRISTSE